MKRMAALLLALALLLPALPARAWTAAEQRILRLYMLL